MQLLHDALHSNRDSERPANRRPCPSAPAVQRLERIRRNEAMLRQLGVADAAGGLAAAAAAEQATAQAGLGREQRPLQRPRERRPAPPVVPVPMRKSARQRGERPLTQDEAVAAAAAELNEATAGAAGDTDLGGCWVLLQKLCMCQLCMFLLQSLPQRSIPWSCRPYQMVCRLLHRLPHKRLTNAPSVVQSMLACWTSKPTSS